MSPRPPKPTGKVIGSGEGWELSDGPHTPPRLYIEGQPVYSLIATPRGHVAIITGVPRELAELIQEAIARRGELGSGVRTPAISADIAVLEYKNTILQAYFPDTERKFSCETL